MIEYIFASTLKKTAKMKILLIGMASTLIFTSLNAQEDLVVHKNTSVKDVTIHDLKVDSGCTITLTNRVNITGDIENSGTVISAGTLAFVGDSAQYITSFNGKGKFRNSATKPTASFTNLEFNNSSVPIAVTFNLGDGIYVDGAIFVSGKVAFTNGLVDIGTDNQFVFTTTASATRVNGALIRGFGPGGGAQMVKQYLSGASTFTYHIADNVGQYEYSPVTVKFTANSYPGRAVSVSVFDGVHRKINPVASSSYISRYYRIVGTPIGTFKANLSFSYTDDDVTGDESKMLLSKWDGLKWATKPSIVGNNSIQIAVDENTLSGSSLAEITAKN